MLHIVYFSDLQEALYELNVSRLKPDGNRADTLPFFLLILASVEELFCREHRLVALFRFTSLLFTLHQNSF